MENPQGQINSFPDDVTYILEGLTMEGSLEGGDCPVVVDGKFEGDITANEVIVREKGDDCWNS